MTVYGNDFWEIIKPASTLNLVQNPSVENDTTGWSPGAGAIARTTASQFFGVYGLEVTPHSFEFDGVYFGTDSIPFGLTACTTYTMSVYFKGQSGVPYEMYFANASGAQEGSSVTWTATGDWERQSISYTASTTASRQAWVRKNNDASTGVFIIDGLQVEAQSEATTYCDGDQEGCIWVADPHGSRSWRDGDSKAGGQIIALNSDYDAIVRQQPGAGLPPMENVQTSLGIQDGGLFQRTRTQVRTLTLDGTITGSDINDFHYNRQRLVDLFKPDQGAPQGPFLLRYNSASAITKQLRVHYDSGFDMTQIDNKTEFFSVRLIAYDPYWEEIKDTAQQLDVSTTLSSGDVFVRVGDNSQANEGTWKVLGTLAGNVNPRLGPDNKIYFPTTAGNDTIRRYNPQSQAVETFLPTTAGCGFFFGSPDAGTANAIDFDSAGNLYIGGLFTQAGSTSACNIVKWDGNDFSSIAGNDGLDQTVLTVVVDKKTNTLYVGGIFDNSGSITTCGIAKLGAADTEFSAVGDGFSLAVGAGILAVRDIALEISGSSLYASGCFTSSGSISVCGLAYFDGTEFQNVGNACINGAVWDLEVKPDDTLFFGGNFTGTFPDSAGSPSYFTHWDGTDFTIDSTFSPNTCVRGIDHDSTTGETAVTMAGSTGGTATLPNAGQYLVWNGSTWVYSDLNIVNSTSGLGTPLNQAGVQFLIANSATTASQGTRTVVNNPGTATAYPELVYNLSSGTASNIIYFLDNVSASKSLQFDYTLLEDETVTLSLANGTAISDIRGDIIGNIVPGANFSTWALSPGNNILVAFAESDNTTLFIKWKNRHWSIDGGHS